MSLIDEIIRVKDADAGDFAPHITEELWQQLGETGLLSVAPWPQYDESKTVESTVEMAVQVNGKLKGTIKLAADADKQAAIDAALAEEKVQHAIEGKQIVKQIVVPGQAPVPIWWTLSNQHWMRCAKSRNFC